MAKQHVIWVVMTSALLLMSDLVFNFINQPNPDVLGNKEKNATFCGTPSIADYCNFNEIWCDSPDGYYIPVLECKLHFLARNSNRINYSGVSVNLWRYPVVNGKRLNEIDVFQGKIFFTPEKDNYSYLDNASYERMAFEKEYNKSSSGYDYLDGNLTLWFNLQKPGKWENGSWSSCILPSNGDGLHIDFWFIRPDLNEDDRAVIESWELAPEENRAPVFSSDSPFCDWGVAEDYWKGWPQLNPNTVQSE